MFLQSLLFIVKGTTGLNKTGYKGMNKYLSSSRLLLDYKLQFIKVIINNKLNITNNKR